MSTIQHIGDCRQVLRKLPDESVHCVVTSPPYWGLRDYGVTGQLGLESDFHAYVAAMVDVFCEVRRVLRKDGTLWLNLGDSYASGEIGRHGHKQAAGLCNGNAVAGRSNIGIGMGYREQRIFSTGLPAKNLIGIPWRVAFALQADGWWLRQDIIWSKPNPMPESIRDRCTKAHEYLFLLAKSERYYYDAESIAENLATPAHNPGNKFHAAMIAGPNDRGGHSQWETSMDKVWGANGTRNKRSVWEIATAPYSEAHFATFPPALIEPCIKAGCPIGGTVLDPFAGAGTTGLVADRLQRSAILIELNPDYSVMAARRIADDAPLFAEVTSA